LLCELCSWKGIGTGSTLGSELKLVRTLMRQRERVDAVPFSPDGKVLASVGWDGAIELWTLATGHVEALTLGPGKFYSVTFDPKVLLKHASRRR
jgi:WD40 repeat protein